jgi:hypothetical protein
MPWLVMPLIATSILCRSTGAVVLLLIGLCILYFIIKFKMKILIICLLLFPIIYLSVRATGYWDGDNLAHYLYDNFNQERALSLYARFSNENMLAEKALKKPVLGWGGWGRSRIYDENGKDISITDSLWIIVFGEHGFLGIFALTVSILLPIAILLRLYNIRDWFKPKIAAASSLSILLGLYMIDNLLNAMINPIFMVAAGGIVSLVKEPLSEGEYVVKVIKKPWESPIYQPRFL